MGILDEAIREHLELKRKHGADEADVQRLADEAFGPPSRPGEPEFPEREPEDSAPAGVPDAAEELREEAGAGAGIEEDAIAEPSVEDEATELVPEGRSGEEVGQRAQAEPTSEQPATDSEPSASEQEAAVEPLAPEPVAIDPETDEEEAVFFDRDAEDALDLGELDLSLDDEEDQASEAAVAGLDEPEEEEEAAEQPIETLPTEEHQLEDLEDEVEPGDDVLADTPDFLRDAPEDDELWFEQGEPKDFDFDE